MAAPGSFSVRFPAAGADSGSNFIDAYQRARSLAVQEQTAMLQQALLQERLNQQAALRRASAATMALPDEDIEMAPARTLAGAVTPGTPSVMTPSEIPGGMLPPQPAGEMGLGEPPIPAVPAQELPPAPAAETMIPGTLATQAPDVQVPAVTEQGATMAGLRRTLAGDPDALAALATQEGQAAIKSRGVLSGEEIKYRQNLTEIDQVAKGLADESKAILTKAATGKGITDEDVIGLMVKQAGFHQRRAGLLARKNPDQAAQARQRSEQLFMEAVKLQREGPEERKLAVADLESFAKPLARFNAKGGQTPANQQAVFEAVFGFKSKTYQAETSHLVDYGLKSVISRTEDQRYAPFYGAVLDNMRLQARSGRIEGDRAIQEAMVQYPDQAVTMIGLKGPIGDMVRKAVFAKAPRAVSLSRISAAREEVEAEIRASADPNVASLTDRDPGYWAMIRRKAQENPGLGRREGDRGAWARYRDAKQTMRDEMRAVDSDLGRSKAELRSGRSPRDEPVIQQEIADLTKKRQTLLDKIKGLRPPGSGDPGLAEPEDVAPPADEFDEDELPPPAVGRPRGRAPAPTSTAPPQGVLDRIIRGPAKPPVAPAPPALPPRPMPGSTSSPADPRARASARIKELVALRKSPAEIRQTLLDEGLAAQ